VIIAAVDLKHFDKNALLLIFSVIYPSLIIK